MTKRRRKRRDDGDEKLAWDENEEKFGRVKKQKVEASDANKKGREARREEEV